MDNLLIHSSHFAKLKEKARGVPTSPSTAEMEVKSGGEEVATAPVAYPGLYQALRIKPQPAMALCSDAALAMMECISP
ncbi:hypothetical protein Taro_007396 [Colocasia esculenta]|uniref:Uncharacterized protein n=1 Tax=Colocasia esculenta TaxID=4460 RepID=A0A843TUY8_COLES|nr:hypothetical protein [Colocasia esculenta]